MADGGDGPPTKFVTVRDEMVIVTWFSECLLSMLEHIEKRGSCVGLVLKCQEWRGHALLPPGGLTLNDRPESGPQTT
jgi:hypothetical protein